MTTTVAALFVQRNGVYFNLPDVEPWDEQRDARGYDGPHPVVAHPPCARWCRFAGLVEKQRGYMRGDDNGCFAAALRAVRHCGGVLEHPAWSGAWTAFDLPMPPADGIGWQRGLCGGWAAYVEQGRYGAPVRKATWLYAYGATPPSLRWGKVADQHASTAMRWRGQSSKRRGDTRPTLGKRAASRTPLPFRDELLGLARSAAA